MEERINRQYMAGLIDGEGYIGIMPQNHGYRRYNTPVIKIAMTHPEVIRLVCQTLGGHVHLRSREGSAWKDSFCWEVRTWKMVRKVLEFVHPYLIVKKPQADLMAEFLATQQENGGRYTSIPEEILVKREKLYAIMRKLNHKGRSPAETKSEPLVRDEAIVRATEKSVEEPGNEVLAVA